LVARRAVVLPGILRDPVQAANADYDHVVSVDRSSTPAPAQRSGPRDRTSRRWVEQLHPDHPRHDQAAARLHDVLQRAAFHELYRRRGQLEALSGPELDDVAQQCANDAMMKILARIDDFEGLSRFTTWAYKFVIFEVSGKVSRHFWQRATVPLDAEDWARLPDRFGFRPEDEFEWRDLLATVRRAAEEDLSERQRRIFVAIVVNGVPLDVLVAELATNRNAVYKTLYDARRKVRAALVANGYLTDDNPRRS